MELHAVLEKAIEKNAMKLSSPSRLPHQVCLSIYIYIYIYIFFFVVVGDTDFIHEQKTEDIFRRRAYFKK